MCGRLLPVLALSFALTGPVLALETDQYFSWGRWLEDSTDIVNARVIFELEAVVDDLNRARHPDRISCEKVRGRFNSRFRMLLFNRLELWAVSSPLVSRAPSGKDEFRDYRRGYLYHNTSALDTGTWMPPSPTVEVNGVRIGTDKLTHFIGTSWSYVRWYHSARRKGATHEEAVERALKKGLRVENTILGKGVSGVFSPGDLEANHQGLLFFYSLCEGEEPLLELEDGRWRLARPFDLRDYVTPEWDESYQPVIFTPKRWKKVRPVLLRYCQLLEHPQVVEMRARYAERESTTETERQLAALIADGKIEDPQKFSIERVCAEEATAAAP